ncbi:hypothetical protein BDK51DRAFT_50406 [Blyttiomyces helicus]|uniref:Uncharacterized protein n=1 Tax=Blyttiomyces helicus TaxID=388810 RepID=A0A4P9W7Q2_9FUNG|nr:hypothetical protein BDK51DRAFT_50406 [Blyttiomyces helicus]|eukprot:RKO87415.1 hypothetical protein BDK51DRAFT_50406 [Blyttiomyces helicus]
MGLGTDGDGVLAVDHGCGDGVDVADSGGAFVDLTILVVHPGIHRGVVADCGDVPVDGDGNLHNRGCSGDGGAGQHLLVSGLGGGVSDAAVDVAADGARGAVHLVAAGGLQVVVALGLAAGRVGDLRGVPTWNGGSIAVADRKSWCTDKRRASGIKAGCKIDVRVVTSSLGPRLRDESKLIAVLAQRRLGGVGGPVRDCSTSFVVTAGSVASASDSPIAVELDLGSLTAFDHWQLTACSCLASLPTLAVLDERLDDGLPADGP